MQQDRLTDTVLHIILVVRQTSNRYYKFTTFFAESFSVTTIYGHRLSGVVCLSVCARKLSGNLCVAWCTVPVTGSGRSKTARMLGSWVRIPLVVWTYTWACAVILLCGAGRSFVTAWDPILVRINEPMPEPRKLKIKLYWPVALIDNVEKKKKKDNNNNNNNKKCSAALTLVQYLCCVL